MSNRQLSSRLSIEQSLTPAARTANTTGTGVDLAGFHSAAVYIITGAITDGTHTFEVQESDDNTTFTAVADSDLHGTEPAVGATDDNKVYEIGYKGKKRYIRVSVTVTSATTGGVYGAFVVRGRPYSAPV